MNLPYHKYLFYRREAWIYNLKKTEQGKEMLKNLWRLNQTKADLNKVREAEERG